MKKFIRNLYVCDRVSPPLSPAISKSRHVARLLSLSDVKHACIASIGLLLTYLSIFFLLYFSKNKWYDEVEVQVREATSNSKDSISSKQLLELRQTALDPSKYPTLFSMLWKRITHYKHHRHIEKALYVLIYLVRLKPPSAEVQRRLIDDILQPSQFTDLRLLANLRERKDFPVLSTIRRQANDLLEWLLYMRRLDSSQLQPLPAAQFDLPLPNEDRDEDTEERNGKPAVSGFGIQVPTQVGYHRCLYLQTTYCVILSWLRSQ